MHIVNAIDEIHGGYNIDNLINTAVSDEQHGGSNSILSDLFIPFGLYYQNDRAEYTFYKPQKAGTVDDKLFDYLLDAVSKNRSKPTRKEHAPTPTTNKTRKH